jgi:hypothetical protein
MSATMMRMTHAANLWLKTAFFESSLALAFVAVSGLARASGLKIFSAVEVIR